MPRPSFTSANIFSLLASTYFFYGVVALLVVQAAWIACTGLYPMAFDEGVWLGTIRLYAEHGWPFWSQHPPEANAFGAITRDPSYLYFYVMALPYTVLSWLTDNQAAQVLVLRFMNIALFAWGLFLYRRLLLKTGAGVGLVHVVLLLFVLVPIVPLLAAHINYDNLILPLTALALLLTVSIYDSTKQKTMHAASVMQLLALCLLASVVKYAFLPIFMAIVLFVLFRWWQVYKTPLEWWHVWRTSFAGLTKLAKYSLIGLILLGSILCLERYGVNIVKYQAVVPDCGQVLSYDNCKEYGPWIRDYLLEANKSASFAANPVTFTEAWGHGMWLRSFFAVDGPTTGFQTRVPLLIPGITVIVLAVVAVGAFMLRASAVWRRYHTPVLWLFVLAIAIHVSVLWLQQFQMYAQTGKAVAINGRYLLPVLPLIFMLGALSLNLLIGNRQRVKLVVAAMAILGFMWGGGALTYILRSNDAWYWPQTPLQSSNHWLQDTLGPITPGYNSPNKFLP